MHRLVLDHAYRTGLAWDRSPFRNHGTPKNVLKAGSGLSFNGANSDVEVAPSESLADLRSVWVGCTFFLQAMGGGGARRYNLVEGHLAFALFITHQLQLKGTFRNPDGDWVGVESPPATILPNRAYSVAFHYDGVSTAGLTVDDAVVAQRHDLFGPVQGVASLGVHVGRWPDADQYVFEGVIDRVKIFKEEPNDAARDLADPCCFDEERVREVMNRLREKGHERKELDAWYDRIREWAAEHQRYLTEGSPARTEQLHRHVRGLRDAFARRDGGTLAQRVRQWRESDFFSEDALERTTEAGRSLLEDVPLDLAEIFSLADAICGLDMLLGSVLVDGEGNPIPIERLLQAAEEAGIRTAGDGGRGETQR